MIIPSDNVHEQAMAQLRLIDELLELGDPAEYHNFLIRRLQELKAKLKVMVFDPQLVGPPINGWRK